MNPVGTAVCVRLADWEPVVLTGSWFSACALLHQSRPCLGQRAVRVMSFFVYPTGPSCSRIPVSQRNPTMLRMVLEALKAREKRQGTSVIAIKVYIQHKYPTVDTTRFKYLLKQALETGVRRGLLTRPANSKAKGATGSFKVSYRQGEGGRGASSRHQALSTHC